MNVGAFCARPNLDLRDCSRIAHSSTQQPLPLKGGELSQVGIECSPRMLCPAGSLAIASPAFDSPAIELRSRNSGQMNHTGHTLRAD